MTEVISTMPVLMGMNPLIVITLLAWTLIWKGLALWRAAELRQKGWFIAFLIINTLGILEIIYLFGVARNHRVEVIDESH